MPDISQAPPVVVVFRCENPLNPDGRGGITDYVLVE